MPTIAECKNELIQYIRKENFRGYDPYDILLSPFPFQKFGKWIPILATQIQKRSPINFRPLLGIQKDYNPKAMGLFLHAWCNLYEKTDNPAYANQCHKLFNWLKLNQSTGYSSSCWGYNFPWKSPLRYLASYEPSSVATGFIVRGLYKYYEVFKSDQARSLILSAADFISNHLSLYEDETGISISYTPVMTEVCYNASLLGAEVLACAYKLNPDNYRYQAIIQALNFVVDRQEEDGSWYYSENHKTGERRRQIDFHQAYIIESIDNICEYLNINNHKYIDAIRKGLHFYRNEQFDDQGRAYYRLPKKYPTDIHNQAQGIITFSKFNDFNKNYEIFAEQIALWTIQNMFTKNGYFMYRRNRVFKNKIPYIRWSQAWMLLALSYLRLA